MLDTTWSPGLSNNEQPCYQPVLECAYWTVLGCLNKWNIIKFTNKGTPSEEFYEIHRILLDGISENMASLVQKIIMVQGIKL